MSKSKCMACQCDIDNHSILICEDCIGDNCNSFLNYIIQYDESILDLENNLADESDNPEYELEDELKDELEDELEVLHQQIEKASSEKDIEHLEHLAASLIRSQADERVKCINNDIDSAILRAKKILKKE